MSHISSFLCQMIPVRPSESCASWWVVCNDAWRGWYVQIYLYPFMLTMFPGSDSLFQQDNVPLPFLLIISDNTNGSEEHIIDTEILVGFYIIPYTGVLKY